MILTDKELLSAVIAAVMSGKQSERDDACRKLQGHIVAVETERDAREAECEKKDAMYRDQIEYTVKLQRLIEAFCRGHALPYPELHHSKMLQSQIPKDGGNYAEAMQDDSWLTLCVLCRKQHAVGNPCSPAPKTAGTSGKP